VRQRGGTPVPPPLFPRLLIAVLDHRHEPVRDRLERRLGLHGRLTLPRIFGDGRVAACPPWLTRASVGRPSGAGNTTTLYLYSLISLIETELPPGGSVVIQTR
jgi:hypothetical protein